jgi:hypothetical protein
VVFAPGQAIESSLKQLAERRTDIFGVGEPPVSALLCNKLSGPSLPSNKVPVLALVSNKLPIPTLVVRKLLGSS